MKSLSKEKQQTFVVITHDSQIAETADRIINLKDGLIESIKEVSGRNER
jgi:ABC-type lipoprotein export system ATPase subunit